MIDAVLVGAGVAFALNENRWLGFAMIASAAVFEAGATTMRRRIATYARAIADAAAKYAAAGQSFECLEPVDDRSFNDFHRAALSRFASNLEEIRAPAFVARDHRRLIASMRRVERDIESSPTAFSTTRLADAIEEQWRLLVIRTAQFAGVRNLAEQPNR